VQIKEFKTKYGTWVREEDEEGNLQREFYIPKKPIPEKETKVEEHGPKLEAYEEEAKEGEPLPAKYYKWSQSGAEKNFSFVLQRHYPTGKKVPIEVEEEERKVPEMHKADLADTFLEAYVSGAKFKCWACRLFSKAEVHPVIFDTVARIINKIRDHLDLRMEMDRNLLGITIHPPVPGGISSWESFQEQIKSGKADVKTSVTPKMLHPKDWLTEEGELRFPTRHREQPEQEAHFVEIARMEIIDKGKVKYGVQREDLHEYFFFGKKLKGRWVLRKLRIGKEFVHTVWLFMKPEDQKPLDPSYHKDEGYFKIDQLKIPTTEERRLIEQETERSREAEI